MLLLHLSKGYSKIFRPLERGVEEKYRKYFIEALDTLLYLSEDTDAMRKKFGGKVFYRLYKKDQIPLVKSDGTVSSACWPKAREIRYRGISTDSFGEAALVSAVRTDEWDCVVCPLLEAFPDEGEKDEDAYYHMMLFAYSRHLNMPVCMAVLDTPDRERPVISTDGFLDIIAGSSIRPSVIHARDRNTWDILSDMCRKTGIILTMDGDTPGLDEWFSGWMYDEFGDMLDFMDSDDDDIISQREALEIREYIEEVFRYLKQLSNSELKRIPKDLKMLLDKLYDYDQLPDELLVRYERVFGTEDDR